MPASKRTQLTFGDLVDHSLGSVDRDVIDSDLGSTSRIKLGVSNRISAILTRGWTEMERIGELDLHLAYA
jgi:hypothetical protein